MVDEIFGRMPVMRWTVGSFRIAFPVERVREAGGNRIVERERPYRDGAKLDDTGGKAKRWTADVCFNNQIVEPGLEENGFALYPDALNELIRSFDVHETGDLVVPTVGRQRCRAESYDRVEAYEERDSAKLCFTWVEDNEDTLDFRQLQAPSAGSNATQVAKQTVFSAQSVDVWYPTLATFRTFMSQLETAANSPFVVANDVRIAANTIANASLRTTRAFQRLGTPGRDQLARPEGNRTERKLVAGQDSASRAAGEALHGQPRVVSTVLTRDASLFAVAALSHQSLEALIELNPHLDATFVPAGTVVVLRAEG